MHLSSRFVVSTFSLARSLYSQAYGTVQRTRLLRTRQILFAGIPDSTCFVPFVCFVRWLVRLVRWTQFARLRLHTRAVVAYARSVLRSHTHAHAHHIPCTPVHWYCIMQPLIAVLSFTHAICCSRCNPCPVTASSVQSPSRWVSTRFIFPCDIRGDTAKSGPDSSITAKNHSLSFCYHRSYNCNNIRINERSLYPFQDLVFYVYFINKKHAFTWRYIPYACTSAFVFAYSMCTPKKTHRS